MGKSKRNNRTRNRPRRPAPKAPPPEPKIGLPGSMTVQEIQDLNARLEERRVLIEFRDAEPETLIIKRKGDERNMEVTLKNKEDMKLRVILGGLVSSTERNLEEMGIDISALDGDGEPTPPDDPPDGDDGEEGDEEGAEGSEGDEDDDSLTSRLEELLELRVKGMLTEEEHAEQKAKLLNGEEPEDTTGATAGATGGAEG